jgi:predicted  nucleic acid-binding Zn-ribbon protein
MAADPERVRALAARYEELKTRQETLLRELNEVQQRMGEIMLQIIDATRE